MKRLVIYAALAAAAVVPATTGLLSNASFSQTVPVRTPAQAQLLTEAGRTPASATTAPTSPSASPTRHDEAGDDHGGDRIRTATRTDEAGDDHGGDRIRTDEADDHSGSGSGSDDSGSDDGGSSGKGSGGSGSDD
jgi:hypothetical protein